MAMMVTAPLAAAIMVSAAMHAKTQMHWSDMGAKDIRIGGGRAEQAHGEGGDDQKFHGVAPV